VRRFVAKQSLSGWIERVAGIERPFPHLQFYERCAMNRAHLLLEHAVPSRASLCRLTRAADVARAIA
jgi:hypothetical protein